MTVAMVFLVTILIINVKLSSIALLLLLPAGAPVRTSVTAGILTVASGKIRPNVRQAATDLFIVHNREALAHINVIA
jgi:hypothetical protein